MQFIKIILQFIKKSFNIKTKKKSEYGFVNEMERSDCFNQEIAFEEETLDNPFNFDKNIQESTEILFEETSISVNSTKEIENNNFLADIFPIILAPTQKGNFEITVDLPKNHKKGIMEEDLFIELWKLFPENILNNISIILDKGSLYVPDMIYLDYKNNLFIDIEIDEPYTHENNKVIPIHFFGADDERNKIFINNGWYILRFTEEQVVKNKEECINSINSIIKDKNYSYSIKQNIWDKNDSYLLEKSDFRNSYLKLIGKEYSFNDSDSSKKLSVYFKVIQDITIFKFSNGNYRVGICAMSSITKGDKSHVLYDRIDFYCNPELFFYKLISQLFDNDETTNKWLKYLTKPPTEETIFNIFHSLRFHFAFPRSMIIVKIYNPENKCNLSLYETTDFSIMVHNDKKEKMKEIIKKFFDSMR